MKATVKKVRGVFEKVRGSGVWWIRFIDAEGSFRREKAGSRSAAIALYSKRKTEALEGKKLPKKLRARTVRFTELADDYLVHATANNLGAAVDKYRIKKLKEQPTGRNTHFLICGSGSAIRNGHRAPSTAAVPCSD